MADCKTDRVPSRSARRAGAVAAALFGAFLSTAFAGAVPASLTGCQRGQQVRVPRLEPPPKGVVLDPPPPASVHWVRIVSAKLPSAASTGHSWDEAGGLPDPYVAVLIDGQEALRAATVNDTLTPVWSAEAAGSFEFGAGRRITIRLADDDGLREQLIGEAELAPPSVEQRGSGVIDLDLGPSVQVRLAVRPPPALFGLGFSYRFVAGQCHVTSRFEHGPAGRAGLEVGDRIITIGDRPVADFTGAELRSMLLSVPMNGVALQIVHQQGGTTETARVAEGPIYPLHDEHDLVH